MNLRNPEAGIQNNQPIIVNNVDGSTVNQHNTNRYWNTEENKATAAADIELAGVLMNSGILS